MYIHGFVTNTITLPKKSVGVGLWCYCMLSETVGKMHNNCIVVNRTAVVNILKVVISKFGPLYILIKQVRLP